MVVPSLHKLENSFWSWGPEKKNSSNQNSQHLPSRNLFAPLQVRADQYHHFSQSQPDNTTLVEVTLASKSNPSKASLEMCFFHELKKLSNSENKKDSAHTCTQSYTNNCQTSVTCSLPVPIRLYLCLCGRQELLSSRRSRCG